MDGRQRSSIIGGRPAGADDIHATVVVLDAATQEPVCTGTLIAPTVVVTAAHCVVVQDEHTGPILAEVAPADLRVGAAVLDALSAPNTAQHAVREIARHGEYPQVSSDDPVGWGVMHDIAVLLLAEPIETLQPAPILPLSAVDDVLRQGAMLTVAGYGRRDTMGRELGQLYLAETPFQRRTEHELLAGGSGLPDTCPGDSGGPAYRMESDAVWLVGAASRAVPGSTSPCGDGGIYTLLPRYVAWLSEASDGAFAVPSLPDAAAEGDGGPLTMSAAERASGGCSVMRPGARVGAGLAAPWAGRLGRPETVR